MGDTRRLEAVICDGWEFDNVCEIMGFSGIQYYMRTTLLMTRGERLVIHIKFNNIRIFLIDVRTSKY